MEDNLSSVNSLTYTTTASFQDEDGKEEEAVAPNAAPEAFNFTGGASGGGAANNGGAGFNF